jgi:hypothetical protein
MYWRTPIDQLLSPPSFGTAPRVRLGDLVQTLTRFSNPLWPARAPAAPFAGEEGDQGFVSKTERRHA